MCSSHKLSLSLTRQRIQPRKKHLQSYGVSGTSTITLKNTTSLISFFLQFRAICMHVRLQSCPSISLAWEWRWYCYCSGVRVCMQDGMWYLTWVACWEVRAREREQGALRVLNKTWVEAHFTNPIILAHIPWSGNPIFAYNSLLTLFRLYKVTSFVT